jgi:hypothetical protein
MNTTRFSRLSFAILLAVSCGTAGRAQHYRDTGPLDTWTTNEVSRVTEPDGQLRVVRAAKQDSFDRVVFEFADGVPSFLVSYPTSTLYDIGTQARLKISGGAVLEVSMHFNYGEHTDIYQGFPRGKLDLPALLEIKNIDFSEGVMAFALGLRERHAFRVSTLTKPARLVVDVRH